MTSKFDTWLSDSSTGTSKTIAVERIGRLPGVIGSSMRSSVANANVPATSGASLVAGLSPAVATSLCAKYERLPGDQYDDRLAGYELGAAVEPVDLEEARALVAAALAPCAPAVITRELIRLRLVTAKRDGDQPITDLALAVYAEDLGEYPEDIVAAVCRKFRGPGESPFFPTLPELCTAAEALMRERRMIAEAIKRGPPPPKRPPTEAELAEARKRAEAIADRERRYAEAAAWRAQDTGPHGVEPPPEPEILPRRLPDLGRELASVREHMGRLAEHPVEMTEAERRLWQGPRPAP